jgi:site-specific recombinase XerD
MNKNAIIYHGEGKDLLRTFYKHLSYRHYSKHTVINYLKEINHLCVHYDCSPEKIVEKQLHDYFFHLTAVKKLGPNKVALAMASFTYFYYNITQTPEKVERLRGPIIPDRIPLVIAPSQVYQFIEGLEILRDKVIVQLMFSTGMRVSESVNMRLRDINKHRMLIRVPEGKGKKGRYVPLSPMMMDQLNLYCETYEPKDYIFYGRRKCKTVPMSRNTVNRIVKRAKTILGTQEEITPHTFRHSFATTLVEEGENLVKVQKILGHANIMTTAHYAKSAKIDLKSCVNPLDKVYQEKSLENAVFEF